MKGKERLKRIDKREILKLKKQKAVKTKKALRHTSQSFIFAPLQGQFHYIDYTFTFIQIIDNQHFINLQTTYKVY